jgi:hypothetical protein
MGNPKRDAFEYGALIMLSGSMAAAYGFLLAYASQKNPDGTRRKLPKVNLEDEVNLRQLLNEMKNTISGISWDNSTLSRFTKPTNDTNDSANSNASTSSKATNAGNTATK